jgi:bile acid:Na+ symporter, BASS family
MFALVWLLPAALVIAMFTLGLGLRSSDFAMIVTRPKAFLTGAVLQVIILPLTAFGVVTLFRLPPELALGLVILALCPGGPTSNIFCKLARGDVALSISLTAAITMSSALTIPVLAGLATSHFLGSTAPRIDVSGLALSILATTLVPVLVGMLLRERRPDLAARIEPSFTALTISILAIFVLLALVSNWELFIANIGGLALSCSVLLVSMLAAGLIAGRFLGLERGQTTSVSIDTAMQNGAMGIAIAAMLNPGQEGISPLAVSAGVYGLLMYAAVLPFALWRRAGK